MFPVVIPYWNNHFLLEVIGYMGKAKKITTCAIMITLSVILTLLSKLIPNMPWGGSVTLASAVPIIIVSLIFGFKWGIMSGITFSIIQMLTGFYPPPTQNFFDFILVVLLDYILAFGVYGLAGVFHKFIMPNKLKIPISGLIVMLLRYICHIFSGILIWGVYADEGQSILSYSVIYNGIYMIPEAILTVIILALLSKFINKIRDAQ